MTREPEALRRGKTFHRLIQAEWLAEAKDGTPRSEKTIRRLKGKRGRIDILVEDLGDMVAVVEIKASDWDCMTPKNVVRNARRQIRQIWSYIDAQIELYDRQVSPGVIFPKRPTDQNRKEQIEILFNDAGIQVVWYDEK